MIYLPERLEYIGKVCFYKSALEQIRLPSALRFIDAGAFCECRNLKTINFPNGLEKIGLDAFMESGLENVELPTSLRTIAQGTFAKCESLKTVKFCEGLEALGTDEYSDDGGLWYGIFQESSIESVELPSTLKRIEYSTF